MNLHESLPHRRLNWTRRARQISSIAIFSLSSMALLGCMESSISSSPVEDGAIAQGAIVNYAPSLPSDAMEISNPVLGALIKGYAQTQINSYISSLSYSNQAYVRNAEIQSVSLSLDGEGAAYVTSYVRFGKEALGVMWDYGVVFTSKLSLVARPDYSDFGIRFDGITGYVTTGKLDWLVDNFVNPVDGIGTIFRGARFWSKSGIEFGQSSEIPVISGDFRGLGNLMLKNQLASIFAAKSGTFNVDGQSITGKITYSATFSEFDLATGKARIGISGNLYQTKWDATLGRNVDTRIGNLSFSAYLKVYIDPIKDHEVVISRKATAATNAAVQDPRNTPTYNPLNQYAKDAMTAQYFALWNSTYQKYYSQYSAEYWNDPSMILSDCQQNWWVNVSEIAMYGDAIGARGTIFKDLQTRFQNYGVNFRISGISP